MKITDIPFNVTLMNLDSKKLEGLRPVTSSDIMSTSGQKMGPTEKIGASILRTDNFSWSGDNNLSSDLHDEGLFSVPIFGRVGDKVRDRKFSYVNIKVAIFHPIVFKMLGKLKSLYTDIMAGKAYAIWDEKEKDFIISNQLDGETGYHFFVKHWKDIKYKKTGSQSRDDKIALIEKYKERAMYNKILIMPAGLRDLRVSNRNNLEYDPINDVYRRIVAISRTIATYGDSVSSPAMNYSRYQLQLAFNALYSTNDPTKPGIKEILTGKSGFIEGKWAKRTVFNGTRNVISTMDTSKRTLGDKNAPKSTDTVVGLFQLMRGILPITIHLIRNSYLSQVFSIGGTSNTAALINKKTLRREMVEVQSLTKDRWTTFDGLNKVINKYFDVENRHKYIEIDDRYLALIYKGPDKTFKIFGDITELPEHLDKKYVEPITLVEFLYLAGYKEWNKYKVVITRYPVAELGSTYPSDVYVKTSVVGEARIELDEYWEPMGPEYTAPEFPTKNPNSFMDSTQISPARLKNLAAD